MGDRIILHIDMDCFFAQIEEKENPQFRGKPIVVGADPKGGSGRGVVSTANYEARKYGIHSAMPISKAWQLCPHAIFLPVNSELYTEVSENIMKIIRAFVPIVEQVSLDEAYGDLSTLQWEKAKEFARKIKEEIWNREKLICTCGIGPNKMVAKVACEQAKPNGLLMVKPERVEQFLDPLEIQEIPGIGPHGASLLHAERVFTVRELKKLPKERLRELFGVRGDELYDKARGIDKDPVIPEREVKSISKEHTFERDTRDPQLLIQIFNKLSEELSSEIQEQGFSFRAITVKCRFTGFETHTKSKTLQTVSNDEALLRREAMKLFLRFISEISKPIRLIGIRTQVK